MSWRIEEGDCLQLAGSLPDNSMDCLVTDPPYELEFMHKSWDSSGIAFRVDTWREAFRVVKPGGHLLAFSGTRTCHRMVCAIEDAGFQVLDQLQWLYSTGMPHGLDIEKAVASLSPEMAAIWRDWNTALSPSHEPICLARKPLSEKTFAANILKWGVGGLNIGATTTERAEGDVPGWHKSGSKGSAGYLGTETFKIRDMSAEEVQARCGGRGRWAKNLMLSHLPDCDGETCVPGCAVAELDSHRGYSKSRRVVMPAGAETPGYGMHKRKPGVRGHDDQGYVSRYFPAFRYIPKPSRREKEAGCEELPIRILKRVNPGGLEKEKRFAPIEVHNHHPTVKPLALMRWLVRLVCPPGGEVLDLFAGSGTTGQAAILEGMNFTGFEQDPEMVPVARARCQWAAEQDPGEAIKPARKSKPVPTEQQSLF